MLMVNDRVIPQAGFGDGDSGVHMRVIAILVKIRGLRGETTPSNVRTVPGLALASKDHECSPFPSAENAFAMSRR